MNSDQKKESETRRVLRRERERKKKRGDKNGMEENERQRGRKKKRGIETNRVRNARFSASIERFSLPSPRS